MANTLFEHTVFVRVLTDPRVTKSQVAFDANLLCTFSMANIPSSPFLVKQRLVRTPYVQRPRQILPTNEFCIFRRKSLSRKERFLNSEMKDASGLCL